MTAPSLTCRSEKRHRAVHDANAGGKPFYGLDFVEVKGLTLQATLLGKAPPDLDRVAFRITGGRRVRDIKVTGVTLRPGQSGEDDRLDIVVDKLGDFSIYALEVFDPKLADQLDVPDPKKSLPLPAGFDPRYSSLDVNFRVDCPTSLDCKPPPPAPPAPAVEPVIDYTAKDYESFRRVMLDRMSVVMPDWKERHTADVGITLVELLAYVGDYLSYYQDAVATEAYLDTARRRISVRRHARLVDYSMHDGCNARAWVALRTDSDVSIFAGDLTLETAGPDAGTPGLAFSTGDSPPAPSDDSALTFLPVVLPPEEQLADFDLQNADESVVDAVEKSLQSTDTALAKALVNQFRQFQTGIDGAARNPDPTERPKAFDDALSQVVYGSTPPASDDAFWSSVRPETARLAARASTDHDRQLLNRWILEEAFPGLPSARKFDLYKAHNAISFYTWGEEQCCLPKDTTAATLVADPKGPPLRLRAGDVLIFEEVVGPRTGLAADADPLRRHVVRLTKVRATSDLLYETANLLDVEWDVEEKLPFALWLSVVVPEYVDADGTMEKCKLITDVSLARGNVILADHGRWIDPPEELPAVAEQTVPTSCAGPDRPNAVAPRAVRYAASLKDSPLTAAVPLRRADLGMPAAAVLAQSPGDALPQAWLTLFATANETPADIWLPQRDLVESKPTDAYFVAETDDDGIAWLRFGDGELGRAPEAGKRFRAAYRVGNGAAGNVGAETISRVTLALGSGATLAARNPLPATGGTDPESADVVRELAPYAFRTTPERAVTADDYANLAMNNPLVQGAKAVLRWTGSWYEVIVAIDALHTDDPDAAFIAQVREDLMQYRRIGHALVVRPAVYVPLEVGLSVCVQPQYFRGHVEAALLAVLGSGYTPDGRMGIFHPDQLRFGQGLPQSAVVAAAQAVEGVESVTVTKFRRASDGPGAPPVSANLAIGPLEVARMDNDPNEPENGTLTLEMKGGR